MFFQGNLPILGCMGEDFAKILVGNLLVKRAFTPYHEHLLFAERREWRKRTNRMKK